MINREDIGHKSDVLDWALYGWPATIALAGLLNGGDTLDGNARKLRLNDTPDQTCVTVSTPAGIVAVLDRHQQHMLYLYLQGRFK